MAKTNMLGVIFDNIADNPIIDCNSSVFFLPFNKDEEYFSIYDNYIKYIKECEKLVRKHKFYKKYKSYLIDIVGMKTCQVLSNISTEEENTKDKVTIEMHHGPILTLFDTCAIVLNSLITRHDPDITTFKVANIVIEEHRLNHVRCVLLSKTVHQLVHDDRIMLNYNMGYGDTNEFLTIYKDGIDSNMAHKINKYIKWSMDNDSMDNDVLEVANSLREWGLNDLPDIENLKEVEQIPDSIRVKLT